MARKQRWSIVAKLDLRKRSGWYFRSKNRYYCQINNLCCLLTSIYLYFARGFYKFAAKIKGIIAGISINVLIIKKHRVIKKVVFYGQLG